MDVSYVKRAALVDNSCGAQELDIKRTQTYVDPTGQLSK